MISLLFGALVVCFVIGMPVAFALGVASVMVLQFKSGLPMTLAAQRMFTGTDSFPLMAIPFFMLAGELMEAGGISRRLFDFADALVGFVYGGLSMVAVVAAMFMAGISGAAAADTAAVGAIAIPAMVRKGYERRFAAAVQAAAGSIGVIIPPSIPMIIFGVVGGVSIGKLFMGGCLPGVVIGCGLMVINYFATKRAGYQKEQFRGFREIGRTFLRAVWAIFMPFLILGGIMGGVFTPTEAAVVAVVYSLLVGFAVYRELKVRSLPRIFAKAAISTSVVMLLIATASLFGWILAAERVPQAVAAYLLTLTTSKSLLYALVLAFLIVVGTFMETSAAIIILTPVFLPVVAEFGINPIHFGVIMVSALAIGMLTPPVGICLFISCNIAQIELSEVVRYITPFLFVMILLLVVMTYIPAIVMFLPNLFPH